MKRGRPQNNFKQDLARAQKTQARLAKKLTRVLKDSEVLETDGDKHYDIKLRYKGKEIKFESKEDLKSPETGNMFLEYECRGKPSGITTTDAQYYLLTMAQKGDIVHDYIIPVRTLRQLVDDHKYIREVSGGDDFAAKGYLFRVSDIISNENCAKLEESA